MLSTDMHYGVHNFRHKHAAMCRWQYMYWCAGERRNANTWVV